MRNLIRKIFSKHKRKFVAVGSAAGTAAVMYAVWSTVVVFLMLAVVILHEMGHFYSAQFSGVETGYVVFIPFILGILGITQIHDIPDELQRRIAIAGPVAGVIASAIIFAIVWLLQFVSLILPALLLMLFEALNLVIGADAKRFRAGKVTV